MSKFTERILHAFESVSEEEAEGLMPIGKVVASIGFLISFLLFW